MSKAIGEIAIGAGLIALDLLAPEIGLTLSASMQSLLIGTGSSLVMGGIGTLLTKQLTGLSASTRNPIAPWNAVYGRAKVGGTVVYIEETGESDKYLHMVYVLTCHPCESVDALLFDDNRVVLDENGNSVSFGDSTDVIASQQTVNIASITRTNDVVTVVLQNAIPPPASTVTGPGLVDGDIVQIQNVSADNSLNGQYPVTVVNSTTFTYVCGGNPVSISDQGQAKTTYPDYGDTVHMEVALGTQSPSAPPFPGLLASDDTGSKGLWTSQHLLQGRTAVYLRLKYGGNTYVSGLPTISFLVRGKNDIFDPRTGQNGYTENAALCIADYLTNQAFGFKAASGTEVPTAPLVSAANICDEQVPLASGGTEPRYTCNGAFQLSSKRGEILQNMLTSCAGRLTYSGGQFIIHPGVWVGPTLTIGSNGGGGGSVSNRWLGALCGAFADSAGDVIEPVYLGNGPTTVTVPQGATTLQLGINDDIFNDNTGGFTVTVNGTTYTIPGTTMPWVHTDGLNANLPCGNDDGTAPVTLPVTSGATVTVTYVSGSIELGGFYAPDANGDLSSEAGDNPGNSGNGFPAHYMGGLSVVGNTAGSLSSFAGPFQWKSKLSIRDLYNGVKGTYVCPSNRWQASDFPPYAQDQQHGYTNGPQQYFYDANLAADGGDRRWLDIQLPFTTSSSMAQRLAKIHLMRIRQQGSGTFAFNMSIYPATALDVVLFTLPALGWNSKLLEISQHRFTQTKAENGAIVLGTEIDVQETDPSVYEWSATEELTPQGYQQATLPSANTNVAAPSNVAGQSGSTTAVVGADGIARSRILVTWTPPADGYVTNGGLIQIQYQAIGSSTWIAGPSVDPSVTQAYIDGVTDGQQYLIQVRSVNAAGAGSSWVQAGPVTVSGTASTIASTSIATSGASSGQVLSFDGTAWVPSAAPTVALETNGTNNAVQNKLNLVAGTNITLTADASGDVTITASGGTATSEVRETPSGTLDGVNATFTLSYAPNPISSLTDWLNGVEQRYGVQYTLSGNTIVYTVPPKPTDTHSAQYTH